MEIEEAFILKRIVIQRKEITRYNKILPSSVLTRKSITKKTQQSLGRIKKVIVQSPLPNLFLLASRKL